MAPEPEEKKGGISLQTLLISAASSVVAATVVPLIWERGTVFATAMTPVIVALASEALRKPVETVSASAAKVTRRTTASQVAPTREHASVRGPGGEHFDPLPPEERVDAPAVSEDDPFGLRAKPHRPWLRIGLVTGLLAFFAAAAVVTAGELVGGGSVAGNGKRTTFVGGRKSTSDSDSTKSSREKEKKDEDATATATPSASATETPSAEAKETPSPSATATETPDAEATQAPQAGATATPTATP